MELSKLHMLTSSPASVMQISERFPRCSEGSEENED